MLLSSRKNSRTIYNMIYRDGKTGITFIKRFNVTGVTRDKIYNLTTDHPKTIFASFDIQSKWGS